ncbi:MAG TPA: hypothetical protein VNT03_19430 [Baekduia sp.]|nr:hypothetical protein [Baekduia sp.]
MQRTTPLLALALARAGAEQLLEHLELVILRRRTRRAPDARRAARRYDRGDALVHIAPR